MSIINPIIGGGATESSGGGANPYVSGNYYPFAPARSATNITANIWQFMPFTVREDVTVDELFWYRSDTDAGDVNLGILDKDGVAVTDCSSDSDTTIGTHSVSTTPALLSKDTSYLWVVNFSATGVGYAYMQPAGSGSYASSIISTAITVSAGTSYLPPHYSNIGGTKTMTAAAVTGTIDITGMLETSIVAWGGFRVQ